ncbi:hypothetical protein NCS52_01575300 [Fusarium sp. LHS14.1]|nr:hypothetical protein NCS52_01571100 [Fusarium sp. LHS14.1]KAI8710450.1 hypothetical protein NCS52_01575300 [Fusarium sp. LHS14.1]
MAHSPWPIIESDPLRQQLAECSPDWCSLSMLVDSSPLSEIPLKNSRHAPQQRTLSKSPSQSLGRTLTKSPSQSCDTKVSKGLALQPCRLIQTLSEGSFIIRSIEVIITANTEAKPTIPCQGLFQLANHNGRSNPSRARSRGRHPCLAYLDSPQRSEPATGSRDADVASVKQNGGPGGQYEAKFSVAANSRLGG